MYTLFKHDRQGNYSGRPIGDFTDIAQPEQIARAGISSAPALVFYSLRNARSLVKRWGSPVQWHVMATTGDGQDPERIGPILGSYVNRIACFVWQERDGAPGDPAILRRPYWSGYATGLCSLGGYTLEDAQSNAAWQAIYYGRAEADRYLTRSGFDALKAD